MLKKALLSFIFILAVVLRFYQLPNNPPHLNWDEASLGYNAWTLLQYGTDEYGNVLPFSIRSFNDYKPPLYSYLTMVPVALFGLNEFSTRFISALLGSATVLLVYVLTKEFIHQQQKKYLSYAPFVAALLYALAPWSLQFSRGAFEGNIAVFFTTLGIFFLLKWLRTANLVMLLIAALSLSAALYAYHAARLVVPLIGILALGKYYKYFLKHSKQTLCAAVITGVLIFPLLIITLRGSTGARVGAVTIFDQKYLQTNLQDRERAEKSDGNRVISQLYDSRIQYLGLVVAGYFDHYDISHMFIKGDVVNRHHAPGMGLLYFIELPFIIIGLYTLAVRKFNGKFIFWSWWLLAPLPAALASGTPHAIRAILWLPLPQIAAAVGLVIVLQYVYSLSFKSFSRVWGVRFIASLICVGFVANVVYYLLQYHVHQPYEYAADWQYPTRQLVEYIKPIYAQFDDVIVTTAYDQPYIYFLFYEKYRLENGYNPGDFNRYYKNITFEAVDIFKLRERYKNNSERTMLIVGTPKEIPKGEPIEIKEIPFPDGSIAFRIVTFVEGK